MEAMFFRKQSNIMIGGKNSSSRFIGQIVLSTDKCCVTQAIIASKIFHYRSEK